MGEGEGRVEGQNRNSTSISLENPCARAKWTLWARYMPVCMGFLGATAEGPVGMGPGGPAHGMSKNYMDRSCAWGLGGAVRTGSPGRVVFFPLLASVFRAICPSFLDFEAP